MSGAEWCVYRLAFSNSKQYFGMTCNFRRRMASHKCAASHGRGGKMIARALSKHGWASVRAEIVASGLTLEQAETMERSLIALHKTRDHAYGYNAAEGGRVNVGFKRDPGSTRRIATKETRARMSAAAIARGPSHLNAIRPRKPVFAKHLGTGELLQFESVSDCARKLGHLIHTVHNHIRRGSARLGGVWQIRSAV
jgi:predicted GIY-YIG superfamily endonuclease